MSEPVLIAKLAAGNEAIFVSIIIPCINEADTIVESLTVLQPLRQQGCEIILVDGGSRDATMNVSQPLVDHMLVSKPCRAGQMNAGAAQAQGRWLLFLHADTRLPADISALLVQLTTTERHWGFFSLRLSGQRAIFRLIERSINSRSSITRVATGDQGIFVRSAVFSQMGGYDDIALMEDVALSKRLRKISAPIYWAQPLTTSSRRWQQQGVLKTIVLMWSLRLAFFLGVDPKRLVSIYYDKS